MAEADHLHAFRKIEHEVDSNEKAIELHKQGETHVCHWCGVGMEAFKAEQKAKVMA